MGSDREAWVRVECTFQCRSCAFRVPINGVTDVATCAHCGIEQALDVQQWRELLDEAHAAADHFADADGGDDHRALQASGDNELHAKAKAGHPPCSVCQAPLAVQVDAARAVATCACGATATYELSASARKVSAAKAILSSEHRSDREYVHVDGSEQAIAIKCPQCAAPLPIEQATKFVTCAFCQTQSRIPDRAWFRIASAVPEPEPMWLLFEGPSKKHGRLERERRQAKLAEAKRKATAREAQCDREDADVHAREGERQRADARKRAGEKREEQKKTDKKRVALGLLLLVAIVAATMILVFSIKKSTQLASTTTSRSAPAKKDYDAMIRSYEASCSRAIYPPTDSIAGTPQGTAYQACVDAAKLVASPELSIELRLAHVARACRVDACTEYQVVSTGTMDRERRALIEPWKTLCTSGVTEACTFLANACKAGVQEACVSPPSISPSASSSTTTKRAPR